VYNPSDGEEQKFTIPDLDQIPSFHSEPIEEVGGNVWDDWFGFKQALAANKGRAKRALLWHFLKQDRPEMTFVELVVGAGEVTVEPDAEDIARAREFYANGGGTAEQLREFMEAYPEGKDEAGDEPTGSESPEPASEV
jgi:hypothetical protein